MKPLIKWTGGKSSEIKHFKHLIPDYERYIEPFFGGGALYFRLKPKKAIINDAIQNLMDFYKLVKSGNLKFKEELEKYVLHWNIISNFLSCFEEKLVSIYLKLRSGQITEEELKDHLNVVFDETAPNFYNLFDENFCVSQYDLYECFNKNLCSRFLRMKKKVDSHNLFSTSDIQEHIETAFRSGFYTHFRNFYNGRINSKLEITKEKHVANYYFIREFCFGGMFRQNNSGDFNIPYGGRNYNKKNFERKVKYLLSDEVRQLLQRTTLENDDFEAVIIKHNLSSKDFMFLDPPYDSSFKDYDNNDFSKNDHIRLRDILTETKAKFILIIKETSFIRDLYSDSNFFKQVHFDKLYTSNIKSRYDRNAKHLIIHNLE